MEIAKNKTKQTKDKQTNKQKQNKTGDSPESVFHFCKGNVHL
jgi:hypothetical protein